MIIKKFNNFILEFKETEQNTPTLYKDENLEVKVAKTFDSAKLQNQNTSWCSSSKQGFYGHNKTANMYRINFKDGYKLRLTWDYITQDASELGGYSGGTHWGSGGIVNGEWKSYDYIRPEDDSEPFLFDYKKNDSRQEMVDRIESIPEKAQKAMHEYQKNNSIEKSENLNKMYQEIQKVKLKYIEKTNNKSEFIGIVNYLGNVYKVHFSFDYANSDYGTKVNINYKDENNNSLANVFKNSMAKVYGNNELKNYLIDKFRELAKTKSINIEYKYND